MATIWAKNNGNWTDTTLWAFWNETTQQIEDYGQIPQSDDVVYCNSYTINVSASISFGELHNAENSYTNLSGGFILSTGSNYSIIGNAYAEVNYIIRDNYAGSATKTFVGNLYAINTPIIAGGSGSSSDSNWDVTGNIYGGINSDLMTRLSNSYPNFKNINGYLLTYGNISTRVAPSSINGIWEVKKSPTINYNYTVNGILRITNNAYLKANNEIVLTGHIEYDSTIIPCIVFNNPTRGIVINNPDTFIWKDISEPRSNPFIIVTDAEMNNRQQYPSEDEVKEGTEYVWGQMVGTYTPDYPPESVVLKDYEYGDSDDRKTGTMEQEVNVEVGCVTPEDVRKDVPLVGMGVVGTLVVPSVDDVREGVVFDNSSVGTLIVQGGGDRLRIADFVYYTRSTSITYIVDLTESDKPAFADCEEIVLRSLFPKLDLNNIPDKFFDDLFVQFLRYRLLVEYYRGTSVNSKFTPSEPTTEIVNYANTKCEYWLNTANLFLQLWGEKYPNSVKKDRILL